MICVFSAQVWDLDRLHLAKQKPPLAIYENPVDTVSVAPDCRLIYVKKYYSLSSVRGQFSLRGLDS